MLRTVLGEYLNVAPTSIGIAFHNAGKPFVAEPRAEVPVCFNVSHAGGEILCAIALGREVGVDIERVDRWTNHLGLAERFFSPLEIGALKSLEGNELARRFCTCWARKEAFVKAVGTGLSMPLQAFSVSTEPGEEFALTTTLGSGNDETWTFWNIPEIPGYAACLVAQGSAIRMCFLRRSP
jgi:4'-phosphopantetheinyl transferase